jgi:hypothetical protein
MQRQESMPKPRRARLPGSKEHLSSFLRLSPALSMLAVYSCLLGGVRNVALEDDYLWWRVTERVYVLTSVEKIIRLAKSLNGSMVLFNE